VKVKVKLSLCLTNKHGDYATIWKAVFSPCRAVPCRAEPSRVEPHRVLLHSVTVNKLKAVLPSNASVNIPSTQQEEYGVLYAGGAVTGAMQRRGKHSPITIEGLRFL
jgi:hypothetical protein